MNESDLTDQQILRLIAKNAYLVIEWQTNIGYEIVGPYFKSTSVSLVEAIEALSLDGNLSAELLESTSWMEKQRYSLSEQGWSLL